MAAAALEGAPFATQDIDIWFATIDDDRIHEAARDAGGFWISEFGVQPPAFGGDDLSRIDVVLTAHGLESVDADYESAVDHVLDGLSLRVLPLARVIASKPSTGRQKDKAQLPGLEATLAARQEPPDEP